MQGKTKEETAPFGVQQEEVGGVDGLQQQQGSGAVSAAEAARGASASAPATPSAASAAAVAAAAAAATDPFASVEGTVRHSAAMRSFAEARGDSTFPSVHTPNLIPDLGQVDFVFIDKTGTLTGNDMTFSMCSVVGR